MHIDALARLRINAKHDNCTFGGKGTGSKARSKKVEPESRVHCAEEFLVEFRRLSLPMSLLINLYIIRYLIIFTAI